MKTVALLSQKGGTGKTTLSLHLAVAAQLAGKDAVVIDLDPQASAAGWKDSRAVSRRLSSQYQPHAFKSHCVLPRKARQPWRCSILLPIPRMLH